MRAVINTGVAESVGEIEYDKRQGAIVVLHQQSKNIPRR